MKFRCLQTWVPLRKEPSSAAEMVTSLVFGETCTQTDKMEDWLQVICGHDGYSGWIPEYYLTADPSGEIWTHILPNQSAFLSNGKSRLHLSAGSNLPADGNISIEGESFELTIRDPQTHSENWKTALGFLYVPYLWGGRSDCGMDCSGLTQIVFKIHGIRLDRDASQQIRQGSEVAWNERQPGDLAFFEKNGKITHVGILAPNNEIIHASGRVRVDQLEPSGIINQYTGVETHKLHSIRRF